VADLIIIAHDGAPCFPPEIPACGGVLVFAPDPAGSKFWIAEATQEQADYITQYPFFTLFKGEAKAFTLSDLTVPDKSWTRAGIAEWALEFLGATIAIGEKKDMLVALQEAIDAKLAAEALKAEDADKDKAPAGSTEPAK